MTVSDLIPFLHPAVLSLTAQLAVVVALVAMAGFLFTTLCLPRGPEPQVQLSPAKAHLMNRLHRLAELADDARFEQTRAWIEKTHGPELLVWIRERAEAEGRTDLAARLSQG